MISQATSVHTAALAAIHAAAFPPREAWGEDVLALQLTLPGAFGLIDDRGGMALARVAADEGELLTLAVVPPARRQGIATALLQAAFARVIARGGRTMVLEVSAENTTALALYRRHGFMTVGRRHRYYVDLSDALVLRAKLM